ncbi:MAG TPA: FAD binding domain-containing protein [Acidimicrobiia bacterium]|nr:FAD binding domain-containing protein [Acidimicrobiia bacterium]
MKLPRFEYHAPDTLDEVLSLLAEHGDEAKVLAGGQSLVPLLAMRLARPTQVIDVNRVASLSTIEERESQIVFGATARERTAERSPLVRTQLPLLAEALPFIGHAAIRTRGTIGGTVAHADASAEIPCVVTTLDGEIVVRSAGGERTIAAPDFFQGHFTTALADDECVVEVRLPASDPRAGFAFQEIARRHGDFALVGVAAMVSLGADGAIADSRITLMGVADVPLRARAAEAALEGASPTEETFAAAARTATADLRPATDVHGSAAYRTHLAEVVVRRTLTTAAARARSAQA